MKMHIRLLLLVILYVPYFVSAQQNNPNDQAQQMLSKTKSNFFIENKGQWPDEVLYMARIGGMNAWITNKGVVYDYYKIIRDYKSEQTIKMDPCEREEFENSHTNTKGQVVEMTLEGANKNAITLPTGMQEGYYNYFIGNDSTKWASFVRLYNEVLIQDIYPGIDIRYYFDNGLVRYDYIAKPGVDLAQINIEINGADSYKINENGELTLKTNLGIITHGKLYAYQKAGSDKTGIACTFTKNNNGTVGVIAKDYNPALALVIDPLIYSTYIGGAADEQGHSIVLDGSENAFITGYTGSGNFPKTTGAYDITQNGGADVFVTKLNASGSALIFSTFIGGGGEELGFSIAIDDVGNSFITGYSYSPDYPTTPGAYDETIPSFPHYHVIVTKLNATGSALFYSTFVGGSAQFDAGYSIAIDNSGNAYVTGYTGNGDFPTTAGAYDVSLNSWDAFVTKLNATGSALVYSTFIGGSIADYGKSIAVDINGNAFITGYTTSTDYYTTPGAYNETNNGSNDAFVTKLNATGTALIYSTLIGGGSDDYGYSLAIDTSGNAFITGYTISMNFPATTGAYDESFNGNDVFVAKLNASGSALIYSTFLGPGTAYSIVVDSIGNAFFSGTSGSGYPTTPGAYGNLGGYFVTKLNTTGSTLIYSTFIGDGTSYSIAVDVSGNVFLTGYTTSTYPTTPGAFDVSYNGPYDAFVTKLLPINQALNINFNNINDTSVTCSWTNGGGTKRAVFLKQSATGTAFPINGTAYNADNDFGVGSQIGTIGWYCVYNGTGTSVTINGLSPYTTYRAMVCEYTDYTGVQYYNTDSMTNNPNSFTTIFATPSIQASDITFSNVTENGFTVSCTKGNGTKRTFFIKQDNTGNAVPVDSSTYVADAAFGNGTQIGSSGWYCVYNDADSIVNVSNLTPNTTYRVMVCEYNGTPGNEQYNISTASENPANQITDFPIPVSQAYDIIFSNNSTNNSTVAWTNGSGTDRVVFIKIGDTGSALPSKYTTYSEDNTFGSGSQIGSTGWFCVYNGTGNSVDILGLICNTTYRVMVCEYNGGSGRENYNTNDASNNPANYYSGLTADAGTDKTIVCGGSVQFDNVYTNYTGVGTLTYDWSPTTGLSATDIANPVAEPITTTTYTVTITADGCSATNEVVVNVDPLTISVSDASTTCGTPVILSTTNNYSGSGTLTYDWQPATGLSAPNVSDPSASPIYTTTYTVTLSTPNGCIASDQATVTVNILSPEQICLVTVDTSTWKNKIMWEKTSTAGVMGYSIYKEIATNVYMGIGYVPFSDPSLYIDLSSNPESNSNRYKITVVDSCGGESNRSFYHKTVNLTIAAFGSTMGLNWNDYIDESGIFVPANYFIYRGTTPYNMQILDSVPGGTNSYNDNNVFQIYYYIVGVEKAGGCNTTGLPETRSYSNRKDNTTLVGIAQNEGYYSNALSISPNPLTESTTIKFFNPDNTTFRLTLKDSEGRIVRKAENVTGNEIIVERKDLKAGMYFIELTSESRTFRGKIMVE